MRSTLKFKHEKRKAVFFSIWGYDTYFYWTSWCSVYMAPPFCCCTYTQVHTKSFFEDYCIHITWTARSVFVCKVIFRFAYVYNHLKHVRLMQCRNVCACYAIWFNTNVQKMLVSLISVKTGSNSNSVYTFCAMHDSYHIRSLNLSWCRETYYPYIDIN